MIQVMYSMRESFRHSDGELRSSLPALSLSLPSSPTASSFDALSGGGSESARWLPRLTDSAGNRVSSMDAHGGEELEPTLPAIRNG